MSSQNVGYLLHHITSVLARNSDQVLLEQLGIGFSQFKILLILQELPGVRQKTLAERLGQTEASVSRQIKLLVEGGLATSQISPKSRREHLTYLTSKGSKIIERSLVVLNSYHAPVFAGLSEKEQHQLSTLLSTVHGSICAREH